MPHPFFTYTAEVLAWRLGKPTAPVTATAPDPTETAARADRVGRHVAGRHGVVLAGLGTGHLAAALAESLPREIALTVVCLDPEAARRLAGEGQLGWLTPDGSRQLLADTSAMALFFLLARAGCTPDTTLVTVNPEPAGPEEHRELALWRRLFTGSRPLSAPEPGPAPDRPVLALLARPDEPGLPDFFRALTGLPRAAVIAWDAKDVPDAAREADRLDIPVRHLARPLGNDFAAQRNAVLAACPDGWILGLDPDERPGPGFREALARIMATPGIGGALFPRATLYPDPGRLKIGYGLWPDPQLRLFRKGPPARLRYVRPVHERLEGLAGRAALALDATLLHYNRLLADTAFVSAKLAEFDVAAGTPTHHLSADYPNLSLDFIRNTPDLPPGGRVLLPPPLW